MARDRLITAIDVGTSKIVTVIAAKASDEETPHVVGVSTLKSQGIRKAQVVDIDKVIAAVTKSVEAAERMAGVTVASAIISVGGDQIESLNSKGVVAISEPDSEITEADVSRVIEAAKAISLPSSREILHVLPREFIVDGQPGIADPVGMTGVRLEAETHLITASSTAARNLAKCVSDIGIDVSSLIFSGLASAESVLTTDEKELGVVLVDIGAGTTDICLFIDGALAYSGVIPVGAGHVTNDLAIGLRVSLESAEKIKLALGDSQEAKGGGAKEGNEEIDLSKLGLEEEMKKVSRKTAVEGIVKPRNEEIARLVGEKLGDSGFGGQTPAGVVLTGGGALTVKMAESAKRELALPVRIGQPRGLTGLIEEIEGAEFATVWGLILLGKQAETRVSRLPSWPRFGKILSNLEVRTKIGKVWDFLKSFIP